MLKSFSIRNLGVMSPRFSRRVAPAQQSAAWLFSPPASFITGNTQDRILGLEKDARLPASIDRQNGGKGQGEA